MQFATILRRKDENIYINCYCRSAVVTSTRAKYPVYVDPSIELDNFENAYASSVFANVNYSGGKLWDSGQNAYTLQYYDASIGTNFSFIKPDVSNLKGAKVESATFHAYAVWHYYANQPNGVWLDEVTSGWNVNWNNKPGSNNIAHADTGKCTPVQCNEYSESMGRRRETKQWL